MPITGASKFAGTCVVHAVDWLLAGKADCDRPAMPGLSTIARVEAEAIGLEGRVEWFYTDGYGSAACLEYRPINAPFSPRVMGRMPSN